MEVTSGGDNSFLAMIVVVIVVVVVVVRPLFIRVVVVVVAIIICIVALWSVTNKKRDVSTGPLARPFARSLVCSHRSFVRLLRTARFARPLRCAHSFARSLTSLTPSLVGK